MKKSMAHGSKKWRGHAKRITREGVDHYNRILEEHNIGLRIKITRKGKPVKQGSYRVDGMVAEYLQGILDDLSILDR